MIDLSICPTFKCNLNCRFCYLGDLKRDERYALLDLAKLEDILSSNEIRVLDIYGGEISLLQEKYARELLQMLDNRRIGMTSNALGFIDSPIFKLSNKENLDISFSYDRSRQYSMAIKHAIKEFDELGIGFSIISLDIEEPDYEFMSSLSNLQSISIKPYSPSIYNKTGFSNCMLEIFKTLVEDWPQLLDKVELVNSFRDRVEHLFLLPDGELYDIEYDSGYEKFSRKNKLKNSLDSKCLSCKHFGKCFNEHYSTYVPVKECLGRKTTMDFLDGIQHLHKAY